MDAQKVAASKAIIQRFLATVFADEISRELYQAMKSESFLRKLKKVFDKLYSKELGQGTKALFEFMDTAGVDTYQKLQYEYADLFLNAGNNPVLPYESFYVDREPTTTEIRYLECEKPSENTVCIRILTILNPKIILPSNSISCRK